MVQNVQGVQSTRAAVAEVLTDSGHTDMGVEMMAGTAGIAAVAVGVGVARSQPGGYTGDVLGPEHRWNFGD